MKPLLIAGPCAAESERQIQETAAQLSMETRKRGLRLDYFRAGVWKPRSSPDSFSGAGEQALPWLAEVRRQFGFEVCVEALSAKDIEQCLKFGINTFWTGARTGVNPKDVQNLADAVRGVPCTIMVKNPLVPDLKLWCGNIERFQRAEVHSVMAIHRGFALRSENVYRNAPCWEIPIELKVTMPDLPVLCDPSHLCGNVKWIPQVAQLAMHYGFDGLMAECHCNPAAALSDATQQLTPEAWGEMVSQLDFKTGTSDCMLIKQRALLENIDTQLSELLARRMTAVEEIARIKKENNMAIVQPQQWNQVKKRYLKSDMDEDYRQFIEQFLLLLHQASINRQNNITNDQQ